MKLLEMSENLGNYIDRIEDIFDAVDARLDYYDDIEPDSDGSVYDSWEEKHDDWEEIRDDLEELMDSMNDKTEDDIKRSLDKIGENILKFHGWYKGLSRINV